MTQERKITHLSKDYNSLKEIWDYKNNKIKIDEISPGSNKKVWWKCDKGHSYEQLIPSKAIYKYGCLNCTENKSKKEKELVSFLKSIIPKDIEIIENDRNILERAELDIYIPDKNIAIEFNGIYWHTEKQGKNKWYHYNKWEKCNNKGIQLITVLEDDWERKTRTN